MNGINEYNKKRNFKETKEPKGIKTISRKKLKFVIQHHLARRDHYDLRLELDGTMKSWAVPKGPSYNPKDKRLAVHVEDHPLEYRKFEGTIPKGQYGGGTVMIWDEGYWEPIGNNPQKDFKNGNIKFTLKGKRLKGNWTLVKFKENNWLFIKEKDDYENYVDISKYNTSIKTNRTMKEIESNFKKNDNENVVQSIIISNPEKLIYPNDKITKIEVVKYYEKVADRMMPFLKNRIISTVRCPEGINGQKFFKKHFENIDKGLKKVKLPIKSAKRNDYYYVKDVMGLVSEVQMNSYEFHIWGSTVGNINRPDYMVFDLDPDEGLSLKQLRQGVRDLKEILDELSLKSFLKTSGGKGYHVVVPIKDVTWREFRKIAKNIAELMEVKWSNLYTSNVRMKSRKNRIFIDWIRNTKGATSVAPYSLRVRDNAPVSMPIFWNELDRIKPNEITIDKAIERLKRKDPWLDFWD